METLNSRVPSSQELAMHQKLDFFTSWQESLEEELKCVTVLACLLPEGSFYVLSGSGSSLPDAEEQQVIHGYLQRCLSEKQTPFAFPEEASHEEISIAPKEEPEDLYENQEFLDEEDPDPTEGFERCCQCYYRNRPALTQVHFEKHHKGRRLQDSSSHQIQCKLCWHPFPTQEVLDDHPPRILEYETGPESLVCCCQCDFRSLLPYVELHFRESHTRVRCSRAYPLRCRFCNEGFMSPEELVVHSRFIAETGGTRIRRSVARKSTYSELRRNFVCEECGSRYRRKFELRDHMNGHRNVKPFVCEVCGDSFVRSVGLKLHMRMHTKEEAESSFVVKSKSEPSSLFTVQIKEEFKAEDDDEEECLLEPGLSPKERQRRIAAIARRKQREDPVYRMRDNERQKLRKRLRRQDPQFREQQRLRDAATKRKQRENPEFRKKEIQRCLLRRKQKRADPELLAAIRQKENEYKRRQRQKQALLKLQGQGSVCEMKEEDSGEFKPEPMVVISSYLVDPLGSQDIKPEPET